jgi:hypothetical protein
MVVCAKFEEREGIEYSSNLMYNNIWFDNLRVTNGRFPDGSNFLVA